MPRLLAEGWQVEVMPDFRWQVAAVDAWEGEAQSARYGWLDLDLGHPCRWAAGALLPLLLDVLKRLGRSGDPDTLLARDPDAQLYATLPSGAHVALPVARIAPLTRVLLDLFDGNGTLDAAGRTRIDLGQAALLDGGLGPGPAAPAAARTARPPAPSAGTGDRGRAACGALSPICAPISAGVWAGCWPWMRRERAACWPTTWGLGKTLQVIAFIQTLKNEGKLQGPALVLAPTSVAPNWLREVGRHAPGLRAHLHQGLDRAKRWPDLDQIDLLVTGYPLLLRDHANPDGPDMVALDPGRGAGGEEPSHQAGGSGAHASRRAAAVRDRYAAGKSSGRTVDADGFCDAGPAGRQPEFHQAVSHPH